MSKLSLWKRIAYVCVFCAAVAIASPAQTFTTLVNFDGTNGSEPVFGPLVQGLDGNLYGTTQYDTVFKVTTVGSLTTIYNFNSSETQAQVGLALGTDGNFYGTTAYGGTNSDGTVFKITPEGKLTTLHTFDSPIDGSLPDAALVQATNGNFYGITVYGGANGFGTIFEITPSGKLTTLHGFDDSDGAYPFGTLIEDTHGNFYGTASGGGDYGGGTVFELAPDGALTTLYSFCSADPKSCSDGETPYGGLVHAANGNFYGTTYYGGARGYGTVFEVSPAGALTTLYSFCAQTNCTDGKYPQARLAIGTDGNFYGMTTEGGAVNCDDPFGCGTVFKLTPGAVLTILHTFDSTDGYDPVGRLVQATNGTFYGTTELGGTNFDGTLFSLSVGLTPFVEPVPTSGKVGSGVKILGTNLTGATSVTFNGKSATFTVVSSSEITTTVPTGATTGKVQVTTPSGTLTSNVEFRVT